MNTITPIECTIYGNIRVEDGVPKQIASVFLEPKYWLKTDTTGPWLRLGSTNPP